LGDRKKIIKKGGGKWPGYEEIFTGGIPKRKPSQNPLKQPAPIAVRRFYWRSLPSEKASFASIASIKEVSNNASGKRPAPKMMEI